MLGKNLVTVSNIKSLWKLNTTGIVRQNHRSMGCHWHQLNFGSSIIETPFLFGLFSTFCFSSFATYGSERNPTQTPYFDKSTMSNWWSFRVTCQKKKKRSFFKCCSFKNYTLLAQILWSAQFPSPLQGASCSHLCWQQQKDNRESLNSTALAPQNYSFNEIFTRESSLGFQRKTRISSKSLYLQDREVLFLLSPYLHAIASSASAVLLPSALPSAPPPCLCSAGENSAPGDQF